MYAPILSAAALAALVPSAAAFFRMPCPGRVIDARMDPIVSPGQVAGHTHTVSGGNAFDYTQDYAQSRNSTCSSCPIKADLSNYWTPKLYFQYANGSFIDVHQSGDGAGVYGGMTVYYLQRGGPKNDPLKAFPEGFRMLAGDPFKRNHTGDFASEAVSFVCLNYADGSSTSDGLPTQNCPDGMRAQVFFPSCWDGVNLDSADHKSHMSYPVGGSYDSGSCPSTHPVHLVSIFYEVNYNTGDFNGVEGQFVFAMGDPTGFGFHGDFINGWDVDILQKAIEECTNDSGLLSDCPAISNDLFTTAESQQCVIPPQTDEIVVGAILDKLPGCNPVTQGPGETTPVKGCTDVPAIGPYKTYFKDVTASGWAYAGCASDNVGSRTLTAANTANNKMTVENCIEFCGGKGYTYAGLEYASQCYCGNDVASDRAPVQGILGNCFTPCAGDASEYCGGGSALSLYKKCSGGSCTNAGFESPAGNSGGSNTGPSVVSGAVAPASSAMSSVAGAVSSAVAGAGSTNVQALTSLPVSDAKAVSHASATTLNTVAVAGQSASGSSVTTIPASTITTDAAAATASSSNSDDGEDVVVVVTDTAVVTRSGTVTVVPTATTTTRRHRPSWGPHAREIFSEVERDVEEAEREAAEVAQKVRQHAHHHKHRRAAAAL